MKKLLLIALALLLPSSSLLATSSSLDLVWEADTVVPSWYAGKALPSSGSSVRVVALPFFQDKNGARLSTNQLNFTWRKDGRDIPGVSGLGQTSISYSAGGAGTANNLEVIVSYEADKLSLRQSALVPVVAPEIRLYERDPLWGVLDNATLAADLHTSKPELAISAEPFYFSGDAVRANELVYRWSLNGQPIVSDSQARQTVNFLAPTESAGYRNAIHVRVEHPRLGAQAAEASLNLTFDAIRANPNAFGLVGKWLEQLATPVNIGPTENAGPSTETPNNPSNAGAGLPSLNQYLSEIFPTLISVIAVLAVLAIAYWGVKYILSGVPGIKTVSKERIYAAVLGLLLALSAWLILDTINPNISDTLKDWTKSLAQ